MNVEGPARSHLSISTCVSVLSFVASPRGRKVERSFAAGVRFIGVALIHQLKKGSGAKDGRGEPR